MVERRDRSQKVVSRRAGRLAALLLLLMACPLLAQYDFGACERAEVWRATLDEWAGNGFRVQAAASGLGFAVAWDEARVWIATPAHVVYGEGPQSPSLAFDRSAADRVLVRPLAGGDVLELCDDEHNVRGFGPNRDPAVPKQDLAFVCIRRPAGQYLQRELTAGIISSGDEYRLLGAPNHPRPDALSGRVRVASTGGSRYLELSNDADERPKKGLSGAMVVTPAGLAGLYLGSTDVGRAIDVPTLRQEAADADISWSLRRREFFDCTVKRDVCFLIARPLLPSELILESNGRQTVLAVGGDRSCTPLYEGKYSLRAGDPRLRCEPRSFHVFDSSSPLSYDVGCQPVLAGDWSAGPLGELHCTQGVSGAGSCIGLTGAGRGLFSGTLTWSRGEVALRGHFQGAIARPVRGSLQWVDGQMRGKIELEDADSGPITITLEETR